MTLRCNRKIVEMTIASLREAGNSELEGIVLWLSDRRKPQLIVEAYIPRHVAYADRFWMSYDDMSAMMNHLRSNRRSVAAQVHSHPKLAFHSWIDDQYAIPRHAGALSIVVPFFAAETTTDNFAHSAAFFVLSSEGKWQPVTPPDIQAQLEIQG